MILTKDLFLIDGLAPFDRFKFLKNNNNQGSLVLLLILFQIDKFLKDFLKVSYNYYIEDDWTIKLIFDKVSNNKSKRDFKKNLILLEESGLIYRFTCAKKFDIENKSLKQLRINSWGKDYVLKKKILNLPESKRIKIIIKKEFSKNIVKYQKLIKLLDKASKDSDFEQIKKLNKKIKIKLLS